MAKFIALMRRELEGENMEQAKTNLANRLANINAEQLQQDITVIECSDEDEPKIEIAKGDVDKLCIAIRDIAECGDYSTLALVSRLLDDDWTGSGVYEGLDGLLKKAESMAAARG